MHSRRNAAHTGFLGILSPVPPGVDGRARPAVLGLSAPGPGESAELIVLVLAKHAAPPSADAALRTLLSVLTFGSFALGDIRALGGRCSPLSAGSAYWRPGAWHPPDAAWELTPIFRRRVRRLPVRRPRECSRQLQSRPLSRAPRRQTQRQAPSHGACRGVCVRARTYSTAHLGAGRGADAAGDRPRGNCCKREDWRTAVSTNPVRARYTGTARCCKPWDFAWNENQADLSGPNCRCYCIRGSAVRDEVNKVMANPEIDGEGGDSII